MKKISFETILVSIFIISTVGIFAVPPVLIKYGVEWSITAVLIFGFGFFYVSFGGCSHYEKEYWEQNNKKSKKQLKNK